MTDHEATAKRLLPCMFAVEHDMRECLPEDKGICEMCAARPAVAVALAEREAAYVRIRQIIEPPTDCKRCFSEESTCEICTHRAWLLAKVDAEIAKAGKP